MKRYGIALFLTLASLLCAGSAFAKFGVIDDVPAAVLLLPYFEVNLENPDGINTFFSINNASATPALVHISLFTEDGNPIFESFVPLGGYNFVTTNLRDVFLEDESRDFESVVRGFALASTEENVLWGDYFYVENQRLSALGETLVPIEMISNGTLETLPHIFSARYAHDNEFQTELVIWLGNPAGGIAHITAWNEEDDSEEFYLALPATASRVALPGTPFSSGWFTIETSDEAWVAVLIGSDDMAVLFDATPIEDD